ncbi:MAG: hypothetical protein BJ554DRAFT_5398, partial [Olpidium bornovanus]
MPVRAPAPPSALLLPRPLRLPAAAARRSFGVSRLCRCPQPQRASEPAPSPADPAGTPPPPPPTPTPPPPTPLSGSATSDSFVDRHASVQQRNLPPVPQSREVSLGVPAGSEPRTQPSKCDAPSGPEPVPQSRQEGDSGSEAGRRPPCAVQPWWKSPPHVDKLVREFEERWVRTREEAFGITKEDEKRRVDERVKAKWENKVVSPHGDDVEKFFGFSNDWVTAAVKTSQPKENGVDPATNPMLFTLRVRPWDEIPRPNVKGERMGIVLNRDKDFRIFIVNAKSVFKGSYRRNFTRKLMRGLLEKYLPTHGRPGSFRADLMRLAGPSALQSRISLLCLASSELADYTSKLQAMITISSPRGSASTKRRRTWQNISCRPWRCATGNCAAFRVGLTARQPTISETGILGARRQATPAAR